MARTGGAPVDRGRRLRLGLQKPAVKEGGHRFMTPLYLTLVVVSLLLFVYLGYALLKPEKF